MLKKTRCLTRPTPARQDAPFLRQGRSSSANPRFTFHTSRFTAPESVASTRLADFFNILLDFMARSDMRNSDLNMGMFCLNGSGQRESLLFLSMDEENLARQWIDGSHVSQEIVAIRMG